MSIEEMQQELIDSLRKSLSLADDLIVVLKDKVELLEFKVSRLENHEVTPFVPVTIGNGFIQHAAPCEKDGMPCDYPMNWGSITPPTCSKCLRPAPNMDVTCGGTLPTNTMTEF